MHNDSTYVWHSRHFSRLVIFLLIAGSVFLLAKAYGVMKEARFIGQNVSYASTITVSGTGETSVIPDVGEFSFAVIKEAKEAGDAQEQVSTTMNALLSYLEEFGADEKDVKTTSYHISPRYEFRQELRPVGSPFPNTGKRELVGYEVSHWVSVKVRSLDVLGSVLAELGTRGATNVSNVRFTVEDEQVVRDEARERAIDDAKEKAKVLARDLGVSLVKIVSFHEGGGSVPFRAFAMAESAKFDDGGFVAPEIPVGESTITSNISITYAID